MLYLAAWEKYDSYLCDSFLTAEEVEKPLIFIEKKMLDMFKKSLLIDNH